MMQAARRVGLSFCLVFLLSACAGRAPSIDYAEYAKNDPRTRPYTIGNSDLIRVTVWKDPSLSTETTVRPDGKITVPLVGELQAAGHTARDVQEQLERRLSAYVKDAIVTVAIVEVNSYRFTVAGNVERPGMFTPRYFVTLTEAVALAGGINRFATPSQMILIRPRPRRAPERIPIDYEKILSGERPDENLVVLTGDTLLVK